MNPLRHNDLLRSRVRAEFSELLEAIVARQTAPPQLGDSKGSRAVLLVAPSRLILTQRPLRAGEKRRIESQALTTAGSATFSIQPLADRVLESLGYDRRQVRPKHIVESEEDVGWLFDGKPLDHRARLTCGYCGQQSQRLTLGNARSWFIHGTVDKKLVHPCVAPYRLATATTRHTMKGVDVKQTQVVRVVEHRHVHEHKHVVEAHPTLLRALLNGEPFNLSDEPTTLQRLVMHGIDDEELRRWIDGNDDPEAA